MTISTIPFVLALTLTSPPADSPEVDPAATEAPAEDGPAVDGGEEGEEGEEGGEGKSAAEDAPAEDASAVADGERSAEQPEPEAEQAPAPSLDPTSTQPKTEAAEPGTEADVEIGTTEGSATEGPAEPKPDEDDKPEPETYGMPEGDVELAVDKHPVDYEAISFKPGKGLDFKSKNDKFGMTIRLRAQMRATVTIDEEDDPNTQVSFQIRRARLQFLGYFFGKHNKLKAEFAVSPRDIGLDRGDGTVSKSPLLSWYFEFDQLQSMTVRVGQSKIPFSRQRVISSGNLQLVDRSIANSEFTLDRDLGIEIRSKDFLSLGWLRYYLGVYTGEGHSSYEFNDAGFNYLGRLEFLPFGQFKDYHEADQHRLKAPKLSIGMSYSFVDNAARSRNTTGRLPEDGGTTDYHNAEADVMFKFAGWSVFAEGFFRNGTRNPGPLTDENGDPILNDDGDPISVTDAANGYGYMVQSGFMVPKTTLEFAARFAQVHPFGDSTSLSRKDEVGGGLSYYFARHPFKIQADYFRLFNEGNVANGNHMIRVQLQGAF